MTRNSRDYAWVLVWDDLQTRVPMNGIYCPPSNKTPARVYHVFEMPTLNIICCGNNIGFVDMMTYQDTRPPPSLIISSPESGISVSTLTNMYLIFSDLYFESVRNQLQSLSYSD